MRWRKINTLFRYRIDPICSTFADRKRQDVKPRLSMTQTSSSSSAGVVETDSHLDGETAACACAKHGA
jgi:hypothetical protein